MVSFILKTLKREGDSFHLYIEFDVLCESSKNLNFEGRKKFDDFLESLEDIVRLEDILNKCIYSKEMVVNFLEELCLRSTVKYMIADEFYTKPNLDGNGTTLVMEFDSGRIDQYMTRCTGDRCKQREHISQANSAIYHTDIAKVIFNDKATVIFWVDGTKTVVKCSEHDHYSKETAIAIAYFKHAVGDEYYHYVMSALTGAKGSKVGPKCRSVNVLDMNDKEK